MTARQMSTVEHVAGHGQGQQRDDRGWPARAGPGSRAPPSTSPATCPRPSRSIRRHEERGSRERGPLVAVPQRSRAGSARRPARPRRSRRSVTGVGRSPWSSGSSCGAHGRVLRLGLRRALLGDRRRRSAAGPAGSARAGAAASSCAYRAAPTRSPASSAARTARAAASGSAASRIARTTTTRSAPAAAAARAVSGSMPPIANHGLAARPGGVGDQVPARRRAALPWSASRTPGRPRSSPRRVASAASTCVGRVRRGPDDPVGPDDRARLGDRHVVLADVHAVGVAGHAPGRAGR